MEEENRHLVEQNQNLAKENKALMESSLESRDQHHNQQREYLYEHTQTKCVAHICPLLPRAPCRASSSGPPASVNNSLFLSHLSISLHLSDKFNELRREKQKLVEKIMDQYRVLEPGLPGMCPPKQPKLVRL